MSIIILTIASVAAAFSPQNQPTGEYVGKKMSPTGEVLNCHASPINTKPQMLETGLLKMDGYERFLKEPKMSLHITRNA